MFLCLPGGCKTDLLICWALEYTAFSLCHRCCLISQGCLMHPWKTDIWENISSIYFNKTVTNKVLLFLLYCNNSCTMQYNFSSVHFFDSVFIFSIYVWHRCFLHPLPDISCHLWNPCVLPRDSTGSVHERGRSYLLEENQSTVWRLELCHGA